MPMLPHVHLPFGRAQIFGIDGVRRVSSGSREDQGFGYRMLYVFVLTLRITRVGLLV